MSKKQKDLEKLADLIAQKLREGIDIEECDEDEDLFHELVSQLNEDDIDYILLTPHRRSDNYREGVWTSLDAVDDLLEENFDDYPD